MSQLHRHFGLWQATALNVTMIVGSGVFITIPLMLTKVTAPYALLAWLIGAALMFVDGMVWSELGSALPGSGGSYIYLLECYGREKWGRGFAFLFIWQFLISGPLELASGLISIATFAPSVSKTFFEYNQRHAISWKSEFASGLKIELSLGPAKLVALGLACLVILLLYRRITTLGKLTVTFWIGVLAAIAWILVEGAPRFDVLRAFDPAGPKPESSLALAQTLGETVLLVMYSFLGYYNVCYIGDEVKDPGRTIPRAILLSALLVATLFVGLHLAMLGVVPHSAIPPTEEELGSFSLPAAFMAQIHGDWAATGITLLLIWSCFGSAFCGMLGYARIPYGAARQGHFYAALGKVHPTRRIPHVSLLVVGALTLAWSFFDLGTVITALIVTRILEQFVAQCIGVMVLRRRQPKLARPYRMWLYPLPALLALAGWLWLYVSADPVFITLGLTTLVLGIAAFLIWSWRGKMWPFKN